MAPPKLPPREDHQPLISKIKSIILAIGVFFHLDALSLSQLPLQPSQVYIPIIQPFEDITFHGPTIGPANTIEASDVWSLPDRTCSMDVHWVFRGARTNSYDLIWKDTITIKYFTNSGPNGEIVEIPLSSPAKTECTGDNRDRCSASPVGLLTMTASPQHFYRNSRDEYTFNRDYIHFYYGLPGKDGFVAFHTDTNGHPEDNYLIPTRFPRCTVAQQDPSEEYSRQWVDKMDPPVGGIAGWSYPFYTAAHREFRIRSEDRAWYDGDALTFNCLFPCPKLGP
ncbi:hypothetical protein TWF718_006616 [Orbilia javanica]|uniref:Uncharacterized protein n=1 Tax=Orbilia javanica TaxID=47235 RepID=A0AAN8MSX6_9PEZI